MRATLIIIQAAAITLFAVLGAYGQTDKSRPSCPLPEAQASTECGQ